jgi:tetratricopeptide (TPR) repeat protein
METNLALQEAQLAAQRGDKKRARSILREVIRLESRNEAAWLLLAEFAEKPEHTIAWLELALKINPNNAVAQEKLATLGVPSAPRELHFEPTPEPPTQAKAVTSSSATTPIYSASPTTQFATTTKKSRLPLYGCLAVVALALLCCAGVITLPEINEYINWQAGVAAFNEGNCQDANARFQRILDSPGWGIVNSSSQANQLRQECMAFLEAANEEAVHHFGLALAHYLDFPKLYPESTLNNHIPGKVAALLGQASMEELAVEEVCDRIALLGESELLPRPDDQLPELYYYCGRTYESVGELENAIVMYSIVRKDYPQHYLSSSATEGLARTKIELAKRNDAPPIDQPPESGTAPVGTSVYVVRNDSPERIQLTLSGPESIIEEIPECSVCTDFTREPDACPNQGPIKRITLKPGRYAVVVESASDSGVTPYQGKWNFRSGAEYVHCFYIVATVEP